MYIQDDPETTYILPQPCLYPLRLALVCILQCRYDKFLAFFAIKCASWTSINSGTSHRAPCCSVGFDEYASVSESNTMLERILSLDYVSCFYNLQTVWGKPLQILLWCEPWFYMMVLYGPCLHIKPICLAKRKDDLPYGAGGLPWRGVHPGATQEFQLRVLSYVCGSPAENVQVPTANWEWKCRAVTAIRIKWVYIHVFQYLIQWILMCYRW